MINTEWINQELEKRSWSQSELGRRAGISQATISALINGRSTPTTTTCKAIAKGLNIPLKKVLEGLGLTKNEETSEDEEITELISTLDKESKQALITILKRMTKQ